MSKRDRATEMAAFAAQKQQNGLVCGLQVQHDRSGIGHCWVNISGNDIVSDVLLEIESEMIDGEVFECSDFVASDGHHYRW